MLASSYSTSAIETAAEIHTGLTLAQLDNDIDLDSKFDHSVIQLGPTVVVDRLYYDRPLVGPD